MLTLAEADAELQRLNLLKKNHMDEQYVARRSVRDLPGRIASMNDRIESLESDKNTASQNEGSNIRIGKQPVARDDVIAVLDTKLDSMPWTVSNTTRVPIGSYRGLAFGLILHPSFPPDVYLEGKTTRSYGLSKEHQGPRAVLNAVERIANAYGSEIVRLRADNMITEGQLRDYQQRLGKPFTHEGYLGELTTLRDALKARLSSRQGEEQEQKGPHISELATQIKALKAANTIETTAPRSERKVATTEESVTAPIRRRQESQAAEATATESAEVEANAEMSFKERILRERSQHAEGEGQGPS